jgi:hypothetical protein
MTKPTIVSREAVEIMSAESMPSGKPAAWFGHWVVFFRGNQEPEVMTIAEVEIQAEINRQAEERKRWWRK